MSETEQVSDGSTDTEEQLDKVADTASQMGHSVVNKNEDTVLVDTLQGETIRFTSSLSMSEYAYAFQGDAITHFDDFDEAFSAFVDELLI